MTDQAPTEIETPSGKNAETENFPVGSFLIRADLRPHVHAFYIFARAADDISDNPLLDGAVKVERLEQFEKALLDDMDQSVPSVIPLRESLKKTGVTPQHSLDLLKAFKQDATQRRYKDWADLLDYCRYSASPVGRHVLALHGIGQEAWDANDALCSALQIINHIQDCGDDYAELDRVYIPQDLMTKFGTDPCVLSGEKMPEGMEKTLDAMLDKLAPLMAKAKTFPKFVPDARLKMEVSVIYTLAEKLVKLLRSRDPLCDNVKLGKIATILGTLRGIARAWF